MSYFVFAAFISISVVSAKLFLPVNNNHDIPLNVENLTSHSCKKDIALWIESLRNDTLWAYRMWDATAKYPTGLTEGNTYQLGNFDECLSIDHPFTAQYCLTKIQYTFVLNTPIGDPFSLEYNPYESVYRKLYFKSILLIVTAVALTVECSLGSGKYFDPRKTYSTLEAASFIAFNRFAVPLAIGLYALAFGYGTLSPWITQFLTWSPFVPLSKLAFTANLVHMTLQYINTASERTPLTLTMGRMMFQFNTSLVDIVLSQMIAFVLFMCVENPISRLTKQLLNSGTNEKKE